MKNPIKIRTIFMGTSTFSACILKGLLDSSYNIISVYTRPDKKSGRDQEIKKSEVKLIAEEAKLKIFQPEKFDENSIDELRNQKPDLIIVAAYGKIIPASILEIPGFGALNVHPSLLPKFRGPSPIQNALLLGEKETGTTIMLMDKGIDSGDIIYQKSIKIKDDETYPKLLERMAEFSLKLLLETIPKWVERKIISKKQNEKKATYCQLIERSDGKIIWTDDAISIYNRFRAFYPWPGIFTYFEKEGYNFRLKFNKISLENNIEEKHKSGEVFKLGEKIAVQAEDGAIILEEVQVEGKNKTDISDFINGYPEFIGSILK